MLLELSKLLRLEPVNLVIKRDRLTWFGHVKCKDDSDCNGSGRTEPREHPRETWWDGVKEDMKRFGMCREDAQSQRKWRRKI